MTALLKVWIVSQPDPIPGWHSEAVHDLAGTKCLGHLTLTSVIKQTRSPQPDNSIVCIAKSFVALSALLNPSSVWLQSVLTLGAHLVNDPSDFLTPMDIEKEDDTDETSPVPTTRTLAKVLEDLSIGIMEASNGDTLDPIIAERTMASLIFNTDLYRKENTPFKVDPREHVAKIWEFANLAPDFRVDAYNASSDIDEVKGVATVLVTSKMSGYFEDLACERVSQFKWRRRRGIWRAVELHLLSGGAYSNP